MGLDMYLRARKGFSNYDFCGALEKATFNKIIKALDAEKFMTEESNSVHVDITIAYWRKANQIHNWFVQNVQNGEDNCQESYVSRKQLTELNNLCKQVLENKDQAEKLLPTQKGFFFGGYDYDEWYFKDIKSTIKQLDTILTNVPEKYHFFYRASW